MKRILVCLSITLLLVCLVPLTLAAAKFPTKPLSADGRPTPTPTPKVLSGEAEKVHSAILASVTAERANVLGFLVYQERVEEIKFSQDQSWARAWLIMVDPQTGEPVPSEPGLHRQTCFRMKRKLCRSKCLQKPRCSSQPDR
jgi:hypothetical protein